MTTDATRRQKLDAELRRAKVAEARYWRGVWLARLLLLGVLLLYLGWLLWGF